MQDCQNLFNNIYQGRRVLITGHTGFKGSWLALWLQKLGAEIVGYALEPPTQPNLFDICFIDRTTTSIMADIRNISELQEVMIQYQPEIVFHLAAQALVRASYQYPQETYSTNIMGTANLLEACRRTSSVRTIIIVTSDKCYENREWVWGYRENDSMGDFQ
jgi:CDP-glucose 4,6-dehydratase